MNFPRPRALATALASLLLLAQACSTAPATGFTAITPEQARQSFEATWGAVETGDADPSHGGVDWKAVRERFEPQASACTTRESLRVVLREMLDTLGRSHFGIVPHAEGERLSESARGDRDGSCGLELRCIGSEVIVTDVRADSPAARAGVQRGWSVQRAGTRTPTATEDGSDQGSLDRYARNAVVQALDHGPAGSIESWLFLDEHGQAHDLLIAREIAPGRSTQVGLLPPFTVACQDRILSREELRALGVPEDLRIGWIAFNIWMPALAQDLDAAADRLRDCQGIVLDVRGNPGGVAAMAMGFAGHFHDSADSLGTMRTRDATLEFRVNPRRSTSDGREVKPFMGPLAILVDPLSASTSEIFAGGMQDLGRARVFGRSSAGAALPAQLRTLPSGDSVMFAFADFTLPNGHALEGIGVQPDERSGSAVSDWREGCDPDLRAAARWISTHLRNADCHE
jgi:carboxyl-terminal processing protease